MGCQTFDVTGTHTFTWPAGVTRAVVYCTGGGGGGAAGTHVRGGGAGGGGAFAGSVVSKSDSTATVVTGIGGPGGATSGADGNNGGFSSFAQTTSGTNVSASGGTRGAGSSGGAGGSVAGSTGTIKYAGGNGGDRTSDDGGGGGAAACGTGNGDNGSNGSGTGTGGAGGAECGGSGGNGGADGVTGTSGGVYGGAGGGGGTDAFGGDGAQGIVIVCWEDPLPTGYCVGDSCNKFWPQCGQYSYGSRCFYYGGYYAPDQTLECCDGESVPAQLNLTINNLGIPGNENCYPSQTVHLRYIGMWLINSSPYRVWEGLANAGGSPDYVWISLVDSGNDISARPGECWLRCAQAPLFTLSAFDSYHGPMQNLSCNPLYLHLETEVSSAYGWCIYCLSGVGPSHTFEITE